MVSRFTVLSAVLIISFSLLLAGCREDRSEMEKRILLNDPSFQESLDKRNSIQNELDSQRAAYFNSKQNLEDEIAALNDKKREEYELHVSSIEKTKEQVQPERRTLRRSLLDMERVYTSRRQDLADTERDIKEINSLIQKKDTLELTQEEVRTWNKRLSALIEKKGKTGAEKQKLKIDIETTKLKLKVLKVK